MTSRDQNFRMLVLEEKYAAGIHVYRGIDLSPVLEGAIKEEKDKRWLVFLTYVDEEGYVWYGTEVED